MTTRAGRRTQVLLMVAALLATFSVFAEEDPDALRRRIADLEAQLAAARAQLAQVDESYSEPESHAGSAAVTQAGTSKHVLEDAGEAIEEPEEDVFRIGDLYLGGAIRSNYVLGDYVEDGGTGPQRGGNGGNMELDTFRINLDYNPEGTGWIGKGEYRYYNGYHFAHTGWIGWRQEDGSEWQLGLNRVPFGAGAYGTSHNWFFDQGYYVGLTDDMDVGLRFSTERGPWKLDAAYYVQAEPNFFGDSTDSARYSYDIVDNGTAHAHYSERNQFNGRAIRQFELGKDQTFDAGVSLQASQLKADPRFAEDSWAAAAAAHGKWKKGPWEVIAQLTAYDYHARYNSGSGLSNDLIGIGAYDFEFPVASQGLLPAISVAHTIEPNIDWIDTITFYNDFSVILKDGRDEMGNSLNDSAMNVLGAAFARGGWYIYVDWAVSDGNYFVGDEAFTNFGSNQQQTWQSRFNVNLGYYF